MDAGTTLLDLTRGPSTAPHEDTAWGPRIGQAADHDPAAHQGPVDGVRGLPATPDRLRHGLP